MAARLARSSASARSSSASTVSRAVPPTNERASSEASRFNSSEDAAGNATKWIIQDPRQVGGSVRRQVDDAMRYWTGEDMFENDWFKLMDHGDIRMGREVRVRSLGNRVRTMGSEFEDHWGKGNIQRSAGGK